MTGGGRQGFLGRAVATLEQRPGGRQGVVAAARAYERQQIEDSARERKRRRECGEKDAEEQGALLQALAATALGQSHNMERGARAESRMAAQARASSCAGRSARCRRWSTSRRRRRRPATMD